jgi:hypothetical protein
VEVNRKFNFRVSSKSAIYVRRQELIVLFLPPIAPDPEYQPSIPLASDNFWSSIFQVNFTSFQS